MFIGLRGTSNNIQDYGGIAINYSDICICMYVCVYIYIIYPRFCFARVVSIGLYGGPKTKVQHIAGCDMLFQGFAGISWISPGLGDENSSFWI